MTSIKQRDELQSTIWKIANEVRGAVDGWDFKQFVLGALFYRFISENFTNFIEGGDESVNYANMSDDVITPVIKDDATRTKGYFIYPTQLFVNIAKNANNNPNLNTDLAAIFDAIESSANGYPSEHDIKGLFADFDTTSNRLGNTVEEKNRRLAAVIKGVESLDFGNFEDNEIDLFGDAYEFLISNYAANAGKSGGEFFTPQNVSKLIAQLAMSGLTSVNKIYDPACGSGSLLLQAKKQFDAHLIEEGFFGQEINHTTYNLARMNMFLHNINYDKFDIALGNTLINPQYGDKNPFDAIVSNPPYSVNWVGSDDPTLINDDRFAPAGVLAPKSKADFAFVLHALSYLSARGRAAIVCFPGIFYRGGAEQIAATAGLFVLVAVSRVAPQPGNDARVLDGLVRVKEHGTAHCRPAGMGALAQKFGEPVAAAHLHIVVQQQQILAGGVFAAKVIDAGKVEALFRVGDHPQAVVALLRLFIVGKGGGVGGVVLHYDDLKVLPFGLCPDAVQALFQILGVVLIGDEDAHLRFAHDVPLHPVGAGEQAVLHRAGAPGAGQVVCQRLFSRCRLIGLGIGTTGGRPRVHPPVVEHLRHMGGTAGLFQQPQEQVMILTAVAFRALTAQLLPQCLFKHRQMADVVAAQQVVRGIVRLEVRHHGAADALGEQCFIAVQKTVRFAALPQL